MWAGGQRMASHGAWCHGTVLPRDRQLQVHINPPTSSEKGFLLVYSAALGTEACRQKRVCRHGYTPQRSIVALEKNS